MSEINGKKQILIVEDDVAMQEIYTMMFKPRGEEYEVEIFGDARDAYKRIKERTFDIIILDIYMEPMEGDAFLVCIRDDKDIPEIPVLVVSVLDPEKLEHFKKLKNVDFIKNPVDEEHLVEKIEEMTG